MQNDKNLSLLLHAVASLFKLLINRANFLACKGKFATAKNGVIPRSLSCGTMPPKAAWESRAEPWGIIPNLFMSFCKGFYCIICNKAAHTKLMIELNQDNFDNETSGGKVLVDFWAPWCGPCVQQLDILQSIKNPAYKICKVNVDENKELAKQFRVMGIPTLIALEDGKVKNRHSGVLDEGAIATLFGD